MGTVLHAMQPEIDWMGVVRSLPEPKDTGEPTPCSALSLHVQALTDLLQAGPTPVAGGERNALDVLLDHERNYWRSTVGRDVGPLIADLSVLSDSVAATALVKARDEREAIAILGRISSLDGVTVPELRRLARVVRSLYPPDRGYWGMPQPDLLCDRLLAQVSPETIVDLLRSIDRGQLERALTTLYRANDQGGLDDLFGLLLVESDLADQFAAVLSVGQVCQITNTATTDSPNLTRFSIAIADALLATPVSEEDEQTEELARLLNGHALRLGKVNRYEEEHEAYLRSTAIYESLLAAGDDELITVVGAALTYGNLSGCRARRNDQLGAFTAIRRTVDILEYESIRTTSRNHRAHGRADRPSE
ncbi:MAG: hypothetical protein ACRDR6_00490 [Pseudonocardiaceae bacterium]